MQKPMIPLFRTSCGVLVILCGFSLGLFGCGSETVKKAVDKAKTAVKNTATNVKKQVQDAGRPSESSFSLTIENRTEPLVVSGGKMEMANLKDRPVVVNIESTSSKTGEYPKYFITLRSPGKSITDLVGKAHEASMYFQEKPNSALYATQPANPAKIVIEAGDDFYVKAKLERAELIDASGQDSLVLKGELTSVTPQPKVKEPPKAAEKAAAPVSAQEKIKAAEGGK